MGNGLLKCASGASAWRGYEYYQNHKVLHVEKAGEDTYTADVSGREGKIYTVELHIEHPRKSHCSCPHAAGRRVICKHIVAAYFTLLPEAAKQYYEHVLAAEREAEKQEEEIADRVERYVKKMKKAELQEALLLLLCFGPEWQYDRFVRDHELWH